jgi:ERCC4-type nuclease
VTEQEFNTCPFAIIIDSREQSPYSFSGFVSDAKDKRLPLIVRTKIEGLKTGDYSIEGHESEVTVERKSLVDLYGTIGGGRDRFERELERMAEIPIAHVVIEASWPQIIGQRPERSRVLPKTIFRSINAWEQRYSTIHWHAMGTRGLSEHKTFRILERYWGQI